MLEKIVHQGPVGPEVTVQGKRYLYFGGADYLGMASREQVLAGAHAALDRFGVSSAASRTTSGTNVLHLELESALAAFSGTEDAVIVSAGYLGMQALLEGLSRPDDRALLQRDAHVSIRDAVRLSGLPLEEFELDDLDSLKRAAGKPARGEGRLLVLGEGVSPLMGRIFPLPEVRERLKGTEALVLLDDAHAFGVLGRTGQGTAAHFGLATGVDVFSSATLSKAFGAYGGCVPGPRKLTTAIRERSMAYICATPLPAPVLGAALAAVRLAAERPQIIERLHRNVALLKGGLREIGLEADSTPVPVVPLLIPDAGSLRRVTAALNKAGIIAPLLTYPGSPAAGMIRIAVSALHTDIQIQRLLDCLKKAV